MTAERKCRHTDVIVIGAGAAGLTAATALIRTGLRVIVLEARDRIGGRAHSIDVEDGRIDLGATWFWDNEPRIRTLVEQLNLPTFPQYLDGDAMYEGLQVQRLAGNPVDAPASRFTTGAQGLLTDIARVLPEKALHLGEPVASITVDDQDALVSTALGDYRAEHIILAIPPALAAEQIIFSPQLPEDIRRLAESTAVWMGGVAKAVAVYDRPFWREGGLSGSAISHAGPFREFHDHSGPHGTPAAIFAFAPATAFGAHDEPSLSAAFREQLERLFGPDAAHPREIHTADWSAEHYTQPRNTVAADTSSFGHVAYNRAVHDRIRWASTETSSAYAGHLEGAVLSGLRAAQTIRTPAHLAIEYPSS
ncbi:hypothetical protein BJF89_17220 [Corynebacterium sp. CNJ-954]|uniref:flavin monoamine oxidase family protein n=1 Tax=Corynebacterium sp. CNJ-954 TaxID=1904962 RepID=UPI00096A0E52|nr:NAD(P)/FAD-dependent oxidoreductase [Corynebacterium sp. CNJ-954]OLT54205.1 hypothetical protein BJF89_17220 [Corynebacterium sp. CNJ-954]